MYAYVSRTDGFELYRDLRWLVQLMPFHFLPSIPSSKESKAWLTWACTNLGQIANADAGASYYYGTVHLSGIAKDGTFCVLKVTGLDL